MADLLVDTDVFVDHLRGARRLRPRGDTVSYSVVTRCELFAGAAEQEEAVTLLLSGFRELVVDREVAEAAGRIRRETGVRTPDALIAATAISHRLTLVSRNLKDFAKVPRLRTKAPR